MNLTIETLTAAMNAEIKSLGGIDSAIAACDRMYSQSFRSEPYVISEDPDWEDHITNLEMEFKVACFVAKTGNQTPVKEEVEQNFSPDDDEYDYCYFADDGFYEEMEAFTDFAEMWFDDKYPDFELTGDTKIVCFCNYKGEGEGIGLYELNKDLPVFRSKSESFNQANRMQ